MKHHDPSEVSPYFQGQKLIGDDYGDAEIRKWFADEEEGYADLGAGNRETYEYGFHAFNWHHCFSKLQKNRRFNALGLGSAYGDEFRPIINNVSTVTILEPSEKFLNSDIDGTPVSYKKPDPLGAIDFPDATFDLITCFSVLHHVPNVSFVISEMSRVLSPDGTILLREPSVSMGDWRKPRKGLTKRERGIPENLMKLAIKNAGLKAIHRSDCDFPPLTRLARTIGIKRPFNSSLYTHMDHLLSKAFAWNTRYHRTNGFEKLAPASIVWVLTKADNTEKLAP